MPTVYLWMKQAGEGCDYTIGCGEVLEKINYKDDADLERKLFKLFDDHRWDDERSLEDAKLFTLEDTAMPIYRKVCKAQAKREDDADREEKRAELRRLKAELGED